MTSRMRQIDRKIRKNINEGIFYRNLGDNKTSNACMDYTREALMTSISFARNVAIQGAYRMLEIRTRYYIRILF